MKPTPKDVDREGECRSKPPISIRIADEGNIPGRPSAKVLAFMLVFCSSGSA